MKLLIDFENKTIAVEDNVTVKELLEKIKELNLEEYTIIPYYNYLGTYPIYPTYPTYPFVYPTYYLSYK